ncbi:conserved membrane protein [Cenarchaeum symbiosum A]|uniref:Conserved membrane protein n=1 Tax=Cenarchaeum symbiosum (strain A) TaxID=414004 RepID=A0RU85_CENSY|nr:conserved membrane protein [Cenarchaeum symbiosum A]
MPTAEFKENKLVDVTFMGMRSAIGVIFIVHGFGKFGSERFFGMVDSMVGIPDIGPVLGTLVALGEFVGGILLIIGVLSRISAAVISAIMVGAIFVVKGAGSLTGEGAYELDLILLASCLVIMLAGPGRIALAQIVKKLPRYIH